MAPRANWKGFLKIAEVSCPVALYTAASTAERIAFHTVNRATGHRVHRVFVDAETGEPVEREDQVKGYEVGKGEHIVLEADEIEATVPESDKTLAVSSFVACDDADEVFFDRPYYLAPSDKAAQEAFALIRQGMEERKVAAIARAVLFRRVRTLLIRPHQVGLVATTLKFDYEVRSSKEAFRDVPALRVKGEMLELARHIIETKIGEFDPAKFDDRYEAAVTELVKAKLEGRELKIPRVPKRGKVVDLLSALRESAGVGAEQPLRRPAARSARSRKAAGGTRSHPATKKSTTRRRKTG